MSKNKKSAMIVGAGWTGNMLVHKYNEIDSKYNIKCAIDDDEILWGTYIQDDVKIIGGREKIIEAVNEFNIEEVIIALPSVKGSEKKKIIDIVKETGCKIKSVPDLSEIDELDMEVTRLRNINIEDLLGRTPIRANNEYVRKYITNEVVLITGAGGSIGSELARQVAINRPKKLILIDIYENSVYDLQQELISKFEKLDLEVLIASVRNEKRIDSIIKEYKPNIIFHAAAHKHVPLMENSPNEAIKNNVFGTYNVAKAAGNNNVKKFVLISTDKAVNPTNIMGASKRICEMIIQMFNRRYQITEFVAVRFGNVLGSNGSVVPLFKKQILEGGPVTVTHPEIIRYFMTIPEAVALVLQAGGFAKGGEIFVLDMGEPVKIVDLAKNLIRLSGFDEDDIEIVYTGLRPGEKLYEELLMAEEGMKSTENSLIFIGNPILFDEEEFELNLLELKKMADDDSDLIRQKVKEIVPTYTWNR